GTPTCCMASSTLSRPLCNCSNSSRKSVGIVQTSFPLQSCRVEHWAVHTDAAVIPSIRCSDFRHTTETDADAARHRRFKRYVAGDVPTSRKRCQRPQHRQWPATDQMLRPLVLFQQLRHEAAKSEAAVVGRQLDDRAGLAEIVDAGGKVGASHSIVKRNALCR